VGGLGTEADDKGYHRSKKKNEKVKGTGLLVGNYETILYIRCLSQYDDWGGRGTWTGEYLHERRIALAQQGRKLNIDA